MAAGDIDAVLAAFPENSEAGFPGYDTLRERADTARAAGDYCAESETELSLGIFVSTIARVAAVGADDPDALPMPAAAARDRAVEHLRAAVAAAEAAHDPHTELHALVLIGDVHSLGQHYADAADLFRSILSRADEVGANLVIREQATSKLGDCLLELEQDEEALDWYLRALSLAQQLGDRAEEAGQHGKAAVACGNLDRWDAALEHYEQARALWAGIGEHPESLDSLVIQPNLVRATGVEPALRDLDARIDRTRTIVRRLAKLPRQQLPFYRHARFYQMLLSRLAGSGAAAASEAKTATAFADEWPQIRRGQLWAHENLEHYEAAAQLALSYALTAAVLRGERTSVSERIAWAEAGLAAATRLNDPGQLVAIELELGHGLIDGGNLADAGMHLDRSFALARGLGDAEGEGYALIAQSELHSKRGEFPEALATLEHGRRLAPHWSYAASRANEVGIYLAADNYRAALEPAVSDVEEAKRAGDRGWEAKALANLGTVHVGLGNYEHAVGSLERALILTRELGNRQGEASTLLSLASAHVQSDAYAQAEARSKEAIEAARVLGDRGMEEFALGNLGSVLRLTRRSREALATFARVRALAHERGDLLSEARALIQTAQIEADLGATERALDVYREARVLVGDNSDSGIEAHLAFGTGVCLAMLGNADEGRRLVGLSIERAREGGDHRLLVIASRTLPMLLEREGREVAALLAAVAARNSLAEGDTAGGELDEQIARLGAATDELMSSLSPLLAGAIDVLGRNGTTRYLGLTEQMTGTIDQSVIAAADATLSVLPRWLASEETRDAASALLSESLDTALRDILTNDTCSRALGSARPIDANSNGVRAVAMRIAIYALAHMSMNLA